MLAWCSGLDTRQLAEDRRGAHPAVDEAAVVADLEAVPLDRFHDVKVLGTAASPARNFVMYPDAQPMLSTSSAVRQFEEPLDRRLRRNCA